MAAVTGILETVLYTRDLPGAAAFYSRVIGLEVIFEDPRMVGFDVAGRGVLLIFPQGGTPHPVETPFGVIPAHDGSGPQHIAFAIPAGAEAEWRDRLAGFGVEVESTVRWPRGGASLYFRDPDGHCVELATPGLWPGY